MRPLVPYTAFTIAPAPRPQGANLTGHPPKPMMTELPPGLAPASFQCDWKPFADASAAVSPPQAKRHSALLGAVCSDCSFGLKKHC